MKLAVVLTGGGSRAAYQVGVLRYLIEHFPREFQPAIWCGTSAGAINTAFMVQFADNLERGIHNLSEVWGGLHCTDIYDVSFVNMLRAMTRWFYNLFLGRFINSARYRSLLDTDPLYHMLMKTIDPERIHKMIQKDFVEAVAITATEYGTGKAVIFVESKSEDVRWARSQRVSRRTLMTIDHVMASSSIPILFPAIPVSGIYYGDGSMRDKAPLSPPAKLGADKILAIGVRASNSDMGEAARKYPSLAAIGGTVMNSIFLDSLETDFENLDRVNRLLDAGTMGRYKKIQAHFIRPSQDLGKLAIHYVSEIPRVVRHFVHGFGKAKQSSSDFLSYITFSGGYARALMNIGYEDARLNHDALKAFLTSDNQGEKVSA